MEFHPFEMECPQCGARLEIPDASWIGREASCPDCGSVFVPAFPESSSAEPKPAGLPEEPEDTDIEEEPVPIYQTLFFKVAVGLICLLLAGILLVLMRPNRTPSVSDPVTSEESPSESSAETNPSADSGPQEESEQPSEAENDDSQTDEELNESESPLTDGSEPSELFEDNPVHSDFFAIDENSPEEDAEETDSAEAEPSDSESAAETNGGNIEELAAPSAQETEPPRSDSENREDPQQEEDFDVETFSRGQEVPPPPPASLLPEKIDIQKRLGIKIHQITLTSVSLPDLIQRFYQISGIPAEFDWTTLSFPARVMGRSESFDLHDTDVHGFLDAFTKAFRLEVSVRDDRIRIASPSDEASREETKKFDLADLLDHSDGEKDAAEPENLTISDSVFPPVLSVSVVEQALRSLILEQNGKLEVHGSEFAVTGNARVVREASLFFDRLRSLRRLEPKETIDAEELIPETLCWENRLSIPTTLVLLKPVPLHEALLLLERARGVRFYLDIPECLERGVSPETFVKIIESDESLDRILAEILVPLGLEYLPLSEDWIAVTSAEKAAGLTSCEIHFYAKPDADLSESEAKELADRIIREIEPDSWEADGSMGGKIWIDPVSHSFFIRQSPAVQRKVRRFLQAGLVEKGSS